jgi:hypothetical protein
MIGRENLYPPILEKSGRKQNVLLFGRIFFKGMATVHSNQRVLTGKPLQLEKHTVYTVKSKIDAPRAKRHPPKHFVPRQSLSQMRRAL